MDNRWWYDWAVNSPYPKYFLEEIPKEQLPKELFALIGVQQSPKYHPCGDAWTHTLWVCDHGRLVCQRENLPNMDRFVLMMACLCHDFGKATTTVIHPDGKITSKGHADAGIKPTISFLSGIFVPQEIVDQIIPLVREHMNHIRVIPTERVVDRMIQRLRPATLQMWSWLTECDVSGRPPLPKHNPTIEWVRIYEKALHP